MPTMNFAAASGEWNTAANWNLVGEETTHRVPLSTDDITVTGLDGSGALTITTTNAVCKSVDFFTAGAAFTLSGARVLSVHGNLTCKTGMTWGQSSYLQFHASGILTPNGVSFSSVNRINIETGTLTLAGALDCGTKTIYVLPTCDGLDTGNNTITCGTISDGDNSGTITLTLGSSTINCANVNFAYSTLTVTANTATINVSGTGTANFGSVNWNGATVTFSGDGATLAGNNTFATLNVNTAGLATGLVVTINSIQTVTNFATNGYALNLAKLVSSSAGSHFHLTTASAQISVDYMSIKDSVADQANVWYAGANSTDVSGNSGWVFTAPPPPVAIIALTGTVSPSIRYGLVVDGGKTIILTLANCTWVADDGTFAAQRQNIIDGIDSAQSEANGWDAEVKAKQAVGGVVRTSNTISTITLDAQAAYDITATETITATVPTTALVGGTAGVASPTFSITPQLANLKKYFGVAKADIKKINGVARSNINKLNGVA